MGRNRLPDQRPILRESPLQNRRNPLPFPRYRRSVERGLGHLVRLEPVLASFLPDTCRELCSRMDLEEILLTGSRVISQSPKDPDLKTS